MAESPSSTSSTSTTRSQPESFQKRLIPDDEKENGPPSKKQRNLTAIYETTITVPSPDPNPAQLEAQVAAQFMEDFDVGRSQMHLTVDPTLAAENPQNPPLMFVTSGGSSLMATIQAMRDDIETLKKEASICKSMHQSQMDVVQGAFEIEHKKSGGKPNDEIAILARHRAAHVPRLRETIATFDERHLYEKFGELFVTSFRCRPDMARALQDVDDWVRLVDQASLVWWARKELGDRSPSIELYHNVEDFNDDLRHHNTTFDDIKMALTNDATLRTRLHNLLATGEEVIRSLDAKAIQRALHGSGSTEEVKAG